MWDSVVSVTASPGTKVAADRFLRSRLPRVPVSAREVSCVLLLGRRYRVASFTPKERKGGWVASYTPQGPLPPPKRGLGELNQLSKAKPPGAGGERAHASIGGVGGL